MIPLRDDVETRTVPFVNYACVTHGGRTTGARFDWAGKGAP
jgi:hypothetical protein